MLTFFRKLLSPKSDAEYVSALEQGLVNFDPKQQLTAKESGLLARYKARRYKAVFRPFG